MIAVYSITNTANGRRYVGSSIDVKARLRVHRWRLERGDHWALQLQRSWAKNGPGAFLFEILEEIPNRNALIEREQYWIDHFDASNPKSGYNVRDAGDTREGSKQPDSVAVKMRAFHIGRPKSAEHRAKISAARKGYVMPESTKQKLRDAAARQYSDPAARAKAAGYARMARPGNISPEGRARINDGIRRSLLDHAARAKRSANLAVKAAEVPTT